ncbi:unnamed protein product [Lota lota]
MDGFGRGRGCLTFNLTPAVGRGVARAPMTSTPLMPPPEKVDLGITIRVECWQAFVDFFSRGLEAEYQSQGIIIQGWVTTVLLPAKLVTSYMMGMLMSQRAYYLKKQKQG